MSFIYYVDPVYPWYKKVLAFLGNWLFWFVPAAYDAAADDVGDIYQGQVTLICCFTFALAVALPLILFFTGQLGGWYCLLLAIGIYLLMAIPYYLHVRSWGG